MTSLRWLVALGLACVLMAGLAADDKSDEAKKLDGTWVVASATFDGKALDEMKDGQVTIAGDKFTIKSKDGKETKHTFKVDPSKKPKTMDLMLVKKEPNAAPGLVVYELDGDTLKLAIGPPDKRPTELTDKGHPLVILKRKK
jgi:uncharacterized protein (TIGR03067 family)